MKKLPLLVNAYHGIGDSIYQRPFIRALAKSSRDVFVKTPLPEFFSDIPGLNFVRSNSELRTQKKHESISRIQFVPEPECCEHLTSGYDGNDLRSLSIMQAFEKRFGVSPSGTVDMPSFAAPQITNGRMPIAVIRPTTERDEWCNKSRGPLNEYVDTVSKMLSARGYLCVSIADTCKTQGCSEWIAGTEPFAHVKYHNGELSILETMALIERASVVVTGVGFALIAGIAYQTPTICLLGGHGGNNHPDIVADADYMSVSKIKFVYPDVYCMCQWMDHSCDKHISWIPWKILDWLNEHNL